MKNKMKNLINIIINFFRRLFNAQEVSDHTPVTSAPSKYKIKKHNSAWWRRLYNLESRNKVPSTNLQPLKPFGNFTPHKDFAKPKWYRGDK